MTSGRYVSAHHPFTAPNPDHLDALVDSFQEREGASARCILNGVEIGGGSIRIHDHDIQEKVFRALGIDETEADEKLTSSSARSSTARHRMAVLL